LQTHIVSTNWGKDSVVKTKLLLLAVIIMAEAGSVRADPLLFGNVTALQNNGSTRVDLFSNPGTILMGPRVTFLVDITGTLPTAGTDMLLVTFSQAGHPTVTQGFLIPFFGTIPPPVTLVFSISPLDVSTLGTPVTLTLDLMNSFPDFTIPGGPGAGQQVNSYSYNFNVAAPVPEPATLSLLGAGVTGLLAGYRKRRQTAKKPPRFLSAAASK
jgi:PEP-CTERM motif